MEDGARGVCHHASSMLGSLGLPFDFFLSPLPVRLSRRWTQTGTKCATGASLQPIIGPPFRGLRYNSAFEVESSILEQKKSNSASSKTAKAGNDNATEPTPFCLFAPGSKMEAQRHALHAIRLSGSPGVAASDGMPGPPTAWTPSSPPYVFESSELVAGTWPLPVLTLVASNARILTTASKLT